MKTIIFIALNLMIKFAFAQDYSEFEKLIQIRESIWTNARKHGPHYDGLNSKITKTGNKV